MNEGIECTSFHYLDFIAANTDLKCEKTNAFGIIRAMCLRMKCY